MAETKDTKKKTTTTKKGTTATKAATTKKTATSKSKTAASAKTATTKTKKAEVKVPVKEEPVVKEEIVTKSEEVIVEKAIKKDDARDAKINKRIDIGILTVIIGLFVLVLTTYLSTEMDLSIQTTRILIVSALAIEAIGMIVMIVNIWKRK